MYKRPHYVTSAIYKADHGSKGYEVPEGTPVMAARAGVVWSAALGSRGHAVVIDHGRPYATFYQHLANLKVKKGDQVVAGQELGACGYSPIDSQGIRHLHFALWVGGASEHAVDPEPYVRAWAVLARPVNR